MRRRNDTPTPDLLSDPFGEHSPTRARRRLYVLGGRFEFESESPELLRLVDAAYADLPRHRLGSQTPRFRVGLVLGAVSEPRAHRREEPPPLEMLSAAGFAGGAAEPANFVVVSPRTGTAMVSVSRRMLRFPYHARYELIEFAVFTLAARAQGLVSLHAACIGRRGRGLLLMGPTGSGKSTVTLQCVLQGFEILSEDSVFVTPDKMLATGVPNFLHVRAESLRWLDRPQDVADIRKSPVIRRRSGSQSSRLDLRQTRHRLASAALKVSALVFLSPEPAGRRTLLKPLSKSELLRRLAIHQAYAANQPGWKRFTQRASAISPAANCVADSHPARSSGAAEIAAHGRDSVRSSQTAPTARVKVWRKWKSGRRSANSAFSGSHNRRSCS